MCFHRPPGPHRTDKRDHFQQMVDFDVLTFEPLGYSYVAFKTSKRMIFKLLQNLKPVLVNTKYSEVFFMIFLALLLPTITGS